MSQHPSDFGVEPGMAASNNLYDWIIRDEPDLLD